MQSSLRLVTVAGAGTPQVSAEPPWKAMVAAARDWGELLHHGRTVFLTVLAMLEETGVGLAYDRRTIELENKRPIQITGLEGLLSKGAQPPCA